LAIRLIGRAFGIRGRFGLMPDLVTVSPAWPTRLFWGPRKEPRMIDSFDLRRFVEAQASVYPQVVEELTGGRKRSHWMWFVFPQIAGLGSSAMAQRFAIVRAARPSPISLTTYLDRA
jgi:hypothetical protein